MPVTNTVFVRTTIALLVVGFLTVLLIIAGALWEANRTQRFSAELSEVLEIRREAFRVMTLVLDAETGQRGYLLSRNEAYLDPYEQAVRDIQAEMARLRAAIAKRPQYSDLVERLSGHIDDKLAELADTVELARGGDFAAAVAAVQTDIGRQAMQAVRTDSAELVTNSNAEIVANTAILESTARTLVWLLAGGGVIILSVVAGTAFIAFRYTADLRRAQQEVISLNATLEAVPKWG